MINVQAATEPYWNSYFYHHVRCKAFAINKVWYSMSLCMQRNGREDKKRLYILRFVLMGD